MCRRKCVVPNCGYAQAKSKEHEKRAMFKIPKDIRMAELWAAAIPGLSRQLTQSQTVCERHFEPKFIRRYTEKGSDIVRSRLNTRAVPTLFEMENDPNHNVMLMRYHSNDYSCTSPNIVVSNLPLNSSFGKQTANKENSLRDVVKDLSLSEKLIMDIKQEMFPVTEEEVKLESLEDGSIKTEMDLDMSELTAYEHLHKNFSFYITQLPENWNLTRLKLGSDEVFAFSKECTVCENKALIVMNERNIVINKNGDVHYSIHGKMLKEAGPYTPSVVSNIDALLDVVLKFDDVKVCQGICTSEFEVDKDSILQKDDLGYSRHIDCSLIADKQQCDACWEYSQYMLALMVNNTPVLDNQTIFLNQIYS